MMTIDQNLLINNHRRKHKTPPHAHNMLVNLLRILLTAQININILILNPLIPQKSLGLSTPDTGTQSIHQNPVFIDLSRNPRRFHITLPAYLPKNPHQPPPPPNAPTTASPPQATSLQALKLLCRPPLTP